MGQGAAMAIEDAVSIATLLPYGSTSHDIPMRLEMYQTGRRPRVDLVLHYTRMNGRDENDAAGDRMSGMLAFICLEIFKLTVTAAEMVKIMNICFSHNEIEHSANLLDGKSTDQCWR